MRLICHISYVSLFVSDSIYMWMKGVYSFVDDSSEKKERSNVIYNDGYERIHVALKS